MFFFQDQYAKVLYKFLMDSFKFSHYYRVNERTSTYGCSVFQTGRSGPFKSSRSMGWTGSNVGLVHGLARFRLDGSDLEGTIQTRVMAYGSDPYGWFGRFTARRFWVGPGLVWFNLGLPILVRFWSVLFAVQEFWTGRVGTVLVEKANSNPS